MPADPDASTPSAGAAPTPAGPGPGPGPGATPTPNAGALHHLTTSQRVTLAAAVVLTAAAGAAAGAGATPVTRFIVAGLALAALAALVGQAIEQVAERLSPSATGVLQSTLGNLPELFVGLFALNKGLTLVVRSALVGSILGNAVLVLGCAFIAGGSKHGPQKFDPEEPRLNASLLLLVVAALLVPTLAVKLGTPAAAHATALSDVCAIALLVVYAATLPFYLRRQKTPSGKHEPAAGAWPLTLAVGILVVASGGAAAASDWFVSPLQQATHTLGLSQTFTGLVVVAIAVQRGGTRGRDPVRPQGQARVRHQHHPQQPAAGRLAAHPGSRAAQLGGGTHPADPGVSTTPGRRSRHRGGGRDRCHLRR